MDRFIKIGVGLFLGVWLARYLGPAQFGMLNYAIAFVGLFVSLTNLGLKNIVVRDLVQVPASSSEILGTALCLQVLAAPIAFGLIVLTISLARPDNDILRVMVAVLGFAQVLKSIEIVKYYFESHVESKYVVWVENSLYLLSAAVKIMLILAGAPLIWFVWTMAFEALAVSIGLFVIYWVRRNAIGRWAVSIARGKNLLTQSWPLLLSGLAVMAYMRLDQIMIGHFLGDSEVGVYSAAVRISEAWYFIPMAIIASVFPRLIDTKSGSEEKYWRQLKKLFDLMVLLGLAVAVPMTFLSNALVTVLFGEAYSAAGSVLIVHIWTGLFVALGSASTSALTLDGQQRYILYRALLGAGVNAAGNFILIPAFGVVGAAFATLLSYVVSVFVIVSMRPTRRQGLLMCQALILRRVASGAE